MTEAALIAFLRARLDEREKAAKAMQAVYPTPWEMSDRGWMAHIVADAPVFLDVIRIEQKQAPGADWLGGVIEHVLLQAPDRVLDEIKATRRIVKDCENQAAWESTTGRKYPSTTAWALAVTTLRVLALPHAGHPDYRQEWKP